MVKWFYKGGVNPYASLVLKKWTRNCFMVVSCRRGSLPQDTEVDVKWPWDSLSDDSLSWHVPVRVRGHPASLEWDCSWALLIWPIWRHPRSPPCHGKPLIYKSMKNIFSFCIKLRVYLEYSFWLKSCLCSRLCWSLLPSPPPPLSSSPSLSSS